MPQRAFPVIYSADVERSERFYQRLGFETHFRLPADGQAGYVGLRRGGYELAITTTKSPEQLIGVQVGSGPRFEMFVTVQGLSPCRVRLGAAPGPRQSRALSQMSLAAQEDLRGSTSLIDARSCP
jgi:lactoylglutathione lyase